MERTSVSSSNIASVGYDKKTSTLEVEFKGGGIYQYYNVPATVHAGFLSAESVGKHFHANVKNGGYKYKKV